MVHRKNDHNKRCLQMYFGQFKRRRLVQVDMELQNFNIDEYLPCGRYS